MFGEEKKIYTSLYIRYITCKHNDPNLRRQAWNQMDLRIDPTRSASSLVPENDEAADNAEGIGPIPPRVLDNAE